MMPARKKAERRELIVKTGWFGLRFWRSLFRLGGWGNKE
jgi:hypothetical protein